LHDNFAALHLKYRYRWWLGMAGLPKH